MIVDGLKDIIQYAEVKNWCDNLIALQQKKEFRSLRRLSGLTGRRKDNFLGRLPGPCVWPNVSIPGAFGRLPRPFRGPQSLA